MSPRAASVGANPGAVGSVLRLAASLGLAALLAGAGVATAESLPRWLTSALDRAGTLPEAPRGAVVLEQERRISLLESGKMVRHEHGVLRIVSHDGARFAQTTAFYRTDAGRVRQFRAWTVSPSGVVTPLPEAMVLDAAYIGGDLYNEVRLRHIEAGDVLTGSGFAWEWTVEQAEPFAQVEHEFQDELPVVASRFALELPDDWSVSTTWVNHDPVEPSVSGTTRTWELHDLPDVTEEPLRASARSLVARIQITATPASRRKPNEMPVFSDWRSVSTWLDALAADAGGPDDAVRSQARRLVVGARNELDTLRACARFVQGVGYASIQMGIGRGGGYRPRPPRLVLDRSYGDCKDKANLLRALLAALGQPAYLVAVHAGDPDFVQAEWPSPAPFDHCIVAIHLPAARGFSAELTEPRLGRLLIFDPTDRDTPLGELSPWIQGSLALVVSPGSEGPVRLPELPPDASTIERRIELALEEDGGASGSLRELCNGHTAVVERAGLRQRDATEYRNGIVRWMRAAAPNAEVEMFEVHDDTLASRFETSLRFHAPNAGQTLQGRLMVVRPPLLSRDVVLASDRPRRYPALLTARAVRETLVVRPPDGYQVDELPEPAALEGPLTHFDSRTEWRDGAIVQTRTLQVRRGSVPAGRYEELRGFFARVRAAEAAPIVLARP